MCFWEDDPVQFNDPSYAGGANTVSLNEARANFAAIGASDPASAEHVRGPTDEEQRRRVPQPPANRRN